MWPESRACFKTLPVFVSQIELAILKFPYDTWRTPFQQLKQVVDEPSPQLPADRFSPEFVDFISQWWVAHKLLSASLNVTETHQV